MKAPTTWILVADGGRAFIFASTAGIDAHERHLIPIDEGQFNRDDARHHFGQAPDSGLSGARGEVHYGVSTQDHRTRLAEQQFLEEVLAWLDAPARSRLFDNLIIAAPARPLGVLRNVMSEALRRKLSHEIHADLTKSPIKEIESHVLSHLIPIVIGTR